VLLVSFLHLSPEFSKLNSGNFPPNPLPQNFTTINRTSSKFFLPHGKKGGYSFAQFSKILQQRLILQEPDSKASMPGLTPLPCSTPSFNSNSGRDRTRGLVEAEPGCESLAISDPEGEDMKASTPHTHEAGWKNGDVTDETQVGVTIVPFQ